MPHPELTWNRTKKPYAYGVPVLKHQTNKLNMVVGVESNHIWAMLISSQPTSCQTYEY